MFRRNIITIAAPNCPRCDTGMREERVRNGLVQICPRCQHRVAVLLPLAF